MRFAFPISKFEKQADGSLKISGIATDETLDSQGDVLDFKGSVAAFGKWRGNVREAHDPRKPVGKRLNVTFDDVAKAITVEAFISAGAPDTIQKIQDGILQSFSVGGTNPRKAVAEKVGDKMARRVLEWDMTELSVVDVGANPNANIELVKADGVATDVLAVDELAEATDRFAKALLKELHKGAARNVPAAAVEPIGAGNMSIDENEKDPLFAEADQGGTGTGDTTMTGAMAPAGDVPDKLAADPTPAQSAAPAVAAAGVEEKGAAPGTAGANQAVAPSASVPASPAVAFPAAQAVAGGQTGKPAASQSTAPVNPPAAGVEPAGAAPGTSGPQSIQPAAATAAAIAGQVGDPTMPKDPDGADGIEGVAAAGGSDTEDDMIAGTKKPDPVRGTPVAAPMGAVQGHGGKAADAPLTKAKCAKCMKVHKDGVEACQKDDLAAAQKDGMEASAKSVPAPYPTSNPNCPCCDGSSPTKCTGSDGCCALCRNQSECQMALAVLPNALPASPTVKPTKATDADLRKRRAAVRALVTKYLWGGEENDIADAAAILGRLRDLYASESAEDDEGSAQLELLATAFAAIQRFASLESDELGDDPTADAQGAPPDTSAVPESKDAGGMALALDPKFTKALMPRVLNAYARKIAQSYAPATTPELFKVNHGDQLAEGIGKGLSETHALIAKAQAETRGFVEAGFKGLGETIGKLAKTAAVPMPLRTVPAAAGTGGTSTAAVAQLEAAGNGISDPELRAKWNQALNIAKAIG